MYVVIVFAAVGWAWLKGFHWRDAAIQIFKALLQTQGRLFFGQHQPAEDSMCLHCANVKHKNNSPEV